MIDTLPTGVLNARTDAELTEAAQYLQAVDSPVAIDPLASFNRRATGYITMELSLIVAFVIALLGGWIIWVVLGIGWQTLGRGVIWIGTTLYRGWDGLWWFALAALSGLWIWQDARFQGLVKDPRFALPLDELTWLWVGLLWPIRLLAWGARLAVAALFLLPLLVLPLAACMTLWRVGARTWRWEIMNDRILLVSGLGAAALLVAFGLFVFSDWPRAARPARSLSTSETFRLFFVAVGLAGGLGWLIWRLAPNYGPGPGILGGVLFYILFNWFLRARATRLPVAFDWKIALRKVSLNARQINYLRFLLFVAGLLGLGVLFVDLANTRAIARQGWLVDWTAFVLRGLGVSTQLAPALIALVAVASLGALALMYTMGIGIVVARMAAWPYFALRSEAVGMIRRLKTRRAIRQALRVHRERAHQKVAGRGDRAVCREHLTRFEPQWARLSYGRRWRYWRCPACHSDQSAHLNVRLIRGVFNHTMGEPVRQADDVLLVNLLNPPVIPVDLQEVVVEKIADSHSVEEFVVAYQNHASPVKKAPLRTIRLRVEPDSGLDENQVRILQREFRT